MNDGRLWVRRRVHVEHEVQALDGVKGLENTAVFFSQRRVTIRTCGNAVSPAFAVALQMHQHYATLQYPILQVSCTAKRPNDLT